MNIVIAGGGKIGGALARVLTEEGHDIILIEKDPGILDHLMNKNDITGLVGRAETYDTLIEAGVDRADIFIAVTEKDEINIISSLVAKKMGAKWTVARVRDPNYNKHNDFFTNEMGISLIVNPEFETAEEMYKVLMYPESLSIESFVEDKVHVHEYRIDEGSILVNQGLQDFRTKYGDVLVCLIERDGQIIIPTGSSKILAGDRIFVTGDTNHIESFIRESGIGHRKIRSLMMVGGGIAGYYLINKLAKHKIDIKLFENNIEVAKDFSQAFDDLEVIYGDGTDQDLLSEERIETYDAFIAYTGIDEENILSSLYASKKQVPKILTKVSRTPLLEIVDDSKLQTIITPKLYIIGKILSFVRNISISSSSEVELIHKISENNVEFIQFLIKAKSKSVGLALKDLETKDTALIVCIIRDGELIFPGGENMMKVGDHVIVVTTSKMSTIDQVMR